jgi:hypothetical protein
VEPSKNLLEVYDANMRPNEKLEAAIRWHSPIDQPFQIAGLAWFHQERKYRRLPTLPAGAVPGAVIIWRITPQEGKSGFKRIPLPYLSG